METDFAEGDFIGDVKSNHEHASNPGEEDVGAGFHDV